jgi:hypothetical protein
MPEAFPIVRPVVFPLHGITKEGRCACGWDGCKRIGKHAAVNWGDVEYGSAVPRPAPGAGVGLRTGAHPKGSDVFVVDLDGEAAADVFEDLGGAPDDTLTVKTPRAGGGWHLYFDHPGFHVQTSSGKLGPKIDIRGDGGIIVAPGSPHESGGVYESLGGVVRPAPVWLLDWLRKQDVPTTAQLYPGDVSGSELEYRRGLYAEYLQSEAPARGPDRRGQGDQILFNVVQRGAYDLALPVDDVLELVREHYDPRCSPPWGDELEERVHHKARDAKENSARPRAEPLPEDLAHLAGTRSLTTGFESALADNLPGDIPSAQRISKPESPIVWGRWADPILPPVYLIDSLIPEAKVITLFAEGGSVKSWSAFSIAIAVATGEPWLGRYPVQRGRALILDFEDGRYEFQRRMRLLRGDLEDLPELGYWYCPPYLDKVPLWKELAALELKVLVIDSLSAGMPSDADENSREFSEAVKLAGRFTELGCTVIIIHHANKTGGMRGHGSVRDQSDVAFRFEPVSETDNVKRMRMICDKPGPQKRPAPVNVELSDGGLTTFEDEAHDIGRNADTPQGIAAAIKLALAAGPILTVDKLRQAVAKDQNKVSAELKALIAAGEVLKIERIGFMLDDDAARTRRVLDAVSASDGWTSAAKLAKHSYVTTRFVEGMLDTRVIYPRSSGGEVGGYIIASKAGE